MTNAAIRHLEATPEMGERALERFSGDLIRKQANTEAIAVKALEHLKDEPPTDQKEEPEDDWLNIFSAHAERASSEFLREHWARVLSGEIRQPGSFSYATLQMISVLDAKLANLIIDVGKWVTHGGRVILHKRFEDGAGYRQLITLQDIGFLSLNHISKITSYDDGKLILYGVGYCIVAQIEPNVTKMMPAALLTNSGQELFSIIDLEINPDTPQALGNYLLTQGCTKFDVFTTPKERPL